MAITETQFLSRFEVVPEKGVVLNRYARPALSPHQVEVAPCFSFISAGTELGAIRHISGMETDAHGPFSLGYSLSGIVTAVGSAVDDIHTGERVAAIGAGAHHASRVAVARNLLVPIPRDLSMEVAAAMAMYCFALEGVAKFEARIGENCAIFGAGMMGQITARLLQMMGCRVSALDPSDFRLGFLSEGVTGFRPDAEGWEKLCHWSKPYGIEHASICFGGEATDTVLSLKSLMSHSPDGVPHGRIAFPGGAFVKILMASNMGNIRLISSAKAGPGYRDARYEESGGYPNAYVPHTVRRNMEVLVELIRKGRLGNLQSLFTHRFPFEHGYEAYALLQSGSSDAMGVLLEYETSSPL